ncbi:hypothetical protein [Parvicella tangerina]|uniref:Uncharacterized protein n=1 Tax=Parvicella tangerina TaxID=2829795 RepID=A0A916JRD7_9FLAO|nr:hypothetical protein [Parvicella tangerina]CAG5087455.1 hypothetical protein CRYO30217_03487 [Parvicella tangerina]
METTKELFRTVENMDLSTQVRLNALKKISTLFDDEFLENSGQGIFDSIAKNIESNIDLLKLVTYQNDKVSLIIELKVK